MGYIYLTDDEMSVVREAIVDKLQAMSPDRDDSVMTYDLLDDVLVKLAVVVADRFESIVNEEDDNLFHGECYGC